MTTRAGERAPEAVAFGHRVRELRHAHGWTQEQLAEEAALTPVQLSRIENGANEPKLTTILKLAKAFDIDAATLLAGFTRSVLKRMRL